MYICMFVRVNGVLHKGISCVHLYMNMNIMYIHMYVCILHIYLCICMHDYMYVYTCVYMYIFTYIHMYIYIQTYICKCTTYLQTYICYSVLQSKRHTCGVGIEPLGSPIWAHAMKPPFITRSGLLPNFSEVSSILIA